MFGCAAVQDALRLEVGWYAGGGEAPGQYGAVFNAVGAIAAGLCRNVLIFRTMYEATARKTSNANSRSEEHTSELQSLMRISYAVFCLKKKQKHTKNTQYTH